MRLVLKVVRLPAVKRRLACEALMLVLAVRLGLWLLPLRILRRTLAKIVSPALVRAAVDDAVCTEVVWAVEAVSAYVPGATCLTQALATQALLARRGRQSTLQVGLTRGASGQLAGHAWLACAGKIVIGGTELGHFTTLPVLEGDRP